MSTETRAKMLSKEEQFLEEVSELRHKLQGHSVIQYGSSFTAEAREPDRRRRLLEQLKLARRLRLAMESAADKIEKTSNDKRLDILEENSFNINKLVSLTIAAEGGHQSDYDYNLRLQEQERKKKLEESKVYNTVLNHLVSMAAERTGVLPEPSAASNMNSLTLKKPPSAKKNIRRRSTPSFEQINKMQRPLITKKRDFGSEYAFHGSEFAEVEQGSPKHHQAVQTASRSKRRNVAARRCHNCKSSTSYFRRCNYWFVSGHKCGKVFCSKCLKRKYGEEEPNW
eukprot:CAMPEP_0194207348 /NCGR_PEP_ID=MMETSP0156-20130528/6114_1 /TAXON_ID=33649 /ORGANISM="Thalassionema nitzschioides, Strain L26-B" /LENGTH=282 /DNA_ID=CAMNT_0038934091 /DNA_START=32 /DNA_END=877 /DNA_ORIENTATION=-